LVRYWRIERQRRGNEWKETRSRFKLRFILFFQVLNMDRQQLIDQLANRTDHSQQDLPSPKARYPMLNDSINLKKSVSRSPSPTMSQPPGPQPQQQQWTPPPQQQQQRKFADLVGGIQTIGNSFRGERTQTSPAKGSTDGGEERISAIIRENDALLAQNSRLASDLAQMESEKSHCK
jgi:hypothetical protein